MIMKIITFNKGDLLKESENKTIGDIKLSDIKYSQDHLSKYSMITYTDGKLTKTLKYKEHKIMNKNPKAINVVIALIELHSDIKTVIDNLTQANSHPDEQISDGQMEDIQIMLKNAITGVTNTGPLDPNKLIDLMEKFLANMKKS